MFRAARPASCDQQTGRAARNYNFSYSQIFRLLLQSGCYTLGQSAKADFRC